MGRPDSSRLPESGARRAEPAKPTRGQRRLEKYARRNAEANENYAHCGDITGPLTTPREANAPVEFRHVARPARRAMLTVLVLINAIASFAFIGWLLLPGHVPGHGLGHLGQWQLIVARVAFCAVVIVESIRLIQGASLWLFSFYAKDPVPMRPLPGMKVALLTTVVPAKEPLEIVEKTLAAMRQVEYDGQVDVWILDEGDDDRVKEMAARLGVHHFSRKGRPEYNQADGEFRTKTKSGNHNSWRAEHEHEYHVVAQMDPDHVPFKWFLARLLGYFRDPDVGFVVAPQVYGNMHENWVTRGSSVQQFLFSGVVERGGNGLDAPILIGTNHAYRPSAWAQIGGYQDSIIEDHLTSMRLQGTFNPATGNRWKGVYTPDVLAIGEAPATWSDYFNQQKRWAYGIWEIQLSKRMRAGMRLSTRQRLFYGLVQFYYPSVALTMSLGAAATATYLALGITSVHLDGMLWVTLWGSSFVAWAVLWLWLHRYNLAEHERHEWSLRGMVLALFTGPVYVAAGFGALLRRPLAYAVTAKGNLASAESFKTFRLHLIWAASAAGLITWSVFAHHSFAALRVWAGLTLLMGATPPLLSVVSQLRNRKLDALAVADVPLTSLIAAGPDPRQFVRPQVPSPLAQRPDRASYAGMAVRPRVGVNPAEADGFHDERAFADYWARQDQRPANPADAEFYR